MDTVTFEATIKNFKLSFIKAVDNTAENRRLPSFLNTFNNLLGFYEKVPDQEQFIESYFLDNQLTPNSGIEARARRAYASLVREAHLGLLLRENFTVLPDDQKRDEESGIDYVVDYQGQRFYIHAMVDTPRSNYYRELKDSRRETVTGGLHVNMKLNPRGAKECGMFWIYSSREINQLKQEMDVIVDGLTKQ